MQRSGPRTVALAPGDVFGFYVHTQDSLYGAGTLAINPSSPPPPPPISEPDNAALMLAGVAALALAGRRRRND